MKCFNCGKELIRDVHSYSKQLQKPHLGVYDIAEIKFKFELRNSETNRLRLENQYLCNSCLKDDLLHIVDRINSLLEAEK